jgi:4-amino-4-deoxy-L-arabinose transferase-like glycosyltransferase
MSALPPPPPSSPPPGPAPAPAPKPTVPAPAAPVAGEPPPPMPYDDLFGGEDRPPEAPPNLTFNVAAAPLPPPPPRTANGGIAKAAAPVDVPGIVASDDRSTWVPPRPADEPPDPLLKSPITALPPSPKPYVAAPPPPAKPRSISELMETVGKPPRQDEDDRPSEPQMWTASDALAGKAPPVPKPPAAPRTPPPPPHLPLPPQAPVRAPAFERIAPAPVRTPPPSAAEHRASRPMPLSALSPDDESDYARAFASDDDEDTLMMPGGPTSSSPEADTVIAVAAPMRRAYGSAPSMRLLGMLMTVLLALWIARLGAAPLFDVDEGAFAEATRELTIGHDWGSTTLNGVDRFDKPILIYWFQAISVKLFGITEFAVRLPSALSAFLWCLAIGHFAWRRFGPQVAIAAAGILATTLGPMLIGRAATADSLLNLLLTLGTLDLWRHLENGRDAPRRRAFAWIGLGLLAKGPVALLIPAAAAGLWLASNRDRSRLQRLVSDPVAWALMAGISLPWYIYAVARHGMAFVDGFLLHHNLQRFTGSMEGHAGSLFYYLEVLPAAMMPWTPLLVPIVMHVRTRWREPLGRFMLLWLGFVVVFFSLSGTKLPHYVLYGFTPLMLLAAQELVVARLPVRFGLCAAIIAVVALGAASPWVASALAASTHDPLYRTLLSSAPVAPWVWVSVPICLLVFALTIWVPNVRNYITEAEGAVFAALLAASWMVLAVLPWWGQTVQDPIRTLARTLPIAQMTLQDKQRVVQWRLHQPSIAFYLNHTVERADPVNGDWALTRIDRVTPDELAKLEVVQQVRGYALVRPAPAASEPLSRIGAEQNAAQAASEAASAQALAVAAARVAQAAADAASAAAAAAAAKFAPPAAAPVPTPAPVQAPPARPARPAKKS